MFLLHSRVALAHNPGRATRLVGGQIYWVPHGYMWFFLARIEGVLQLLELDIITRMVLRLAVSVSGYKIYTLC
jgi:hypothetical protein